MSPASRNWQNHIRGLISAISLRDTDHAYSKTNFQLLSFSCVFIVRIPVTIPNPNAQSSYLANITSGFTDIISEETEFPLG